MRQLVEYKIISGRTVEIRRSFMTVRKELNCQPRRAARRAGASSEKKIKANEENCVRELARILNSSFSEGDLFAACKYDDGHLPGSYEEAALYFDRHFLRQLRSRFRADFGRLPVMVWVTANWSPRRKAPARLHHHLVIEAAAAPYLRELWQGGGLNVEWLDNRGDYSDLAAYLVDNVHDVQQKAKWHASRNVSRPVYTEPEAVREIEDVKPEKGSIIKAHQVSTDEEGHVTSAYLRCLLPENERLVVRGGKLVRTKKAGAGKRIVPAGQAPTEAAPPRNDRKGGRNGKKKERT